MIKRASLVVQMPKNQPAMQETWVQSLDWEDPLEKGEATHSSILACRILWSSAFFMMQLSHLYMTTGKTIALIIQATYTIIYF